MINFEPWDQLLRQYVDAQGRVNYRAWKAEKYPELLSWLNELEQLNLSSYSDPNERLALWINLYNALVIAQILKRYPIQSILPKILGIPNWLAFIQFFSRPIYSIGGKDYSLNNIEHDILRSEFKEPRTHFALVCASIGCPLLRNEAYFPMQVQTQLEEDAVRFINNPDKVRYNSHTGSLECSKIFKWYAKDFLKVAPSIQNYIHSYLKTDVPIGASTSITYLYYDWTLNQQIL